MCKPGPTPAVPTTARSGGGRRAAVGPPRLLLSRKRLSTAEVLAFSQFWHGGVHLHTPCFRPARPSPLATRQEIVYDRVDRAHRPDPHRADRLRRLQAHPD